MDYCKGINLHLGGRDYTFSLPYTFAGEEISDDRLEVLRTHLFTGVCAVPDARRSSSPGSGDDERPVSHESTDGTAVDDSTSQLTRRSPEDAAEPEPGTVVLLLESPHKDEYSYPEGDKPPVPIAPAQGKTGDRISAHIHEVIATHLGMGPYSLVICNPIQYQTSMHFVHRQSLWKGRVLIRDCQGRPATRTTQAIRDRVWRTIWNAERDESGSPAERCFLRRLREFGPILIINACTGSRDKRTSPKRMVESAIEKYLGSLGDQGEQVPRYVNVAHPTKW